MVDSPRSLRALGALLGLATAGALALGPASAAVAATGPASQAPHASQAPQMAQVAQVADTADRTPLRVTIDDLAPSYLPRSGEIQVSGTVTNRDDETWTTIKLYSLLGDDLAPMQSPAAVAASLDVPSDAYVGERIIDQGTPGEIEELAPGETSTYTLEVPVEAFQVTRGGVYWFSVHALGASDSSPPDSFTDGRARTLMPSVPERINTSLSVSVVVPLTRQIPYAADGSLDELARWQRSLSTGGRLRDLIDFASGDPSGLTWAVDPALLDAVARLARGNPARSLSPSVETTPPTTDEAPPEGSDSDGDDQGSDGSSGSEGAELVEIPAEGSSDSQDSTGSESSDGAATMTAETAALAQDWLRATREVLEAGQVTTLPYGNLDVPASLEHDPGLLDLARAKTSQVLQGWRISTTPLTTGPNGYLDAASLAATDEGTVLMGDQAFADSRPPTIASVGGRRVVVAASAIADGGPGPGPSLTPVALRQRILAEAAVRVIKPTKEPLVAVLPTNWSLQDGADFFDGLDAPWVSLRQLRTLDTTPTEAVDPDQVAYPDSEASRELTSTTFDDIGELIGSGNALQNLLTDNTDVAGTVAGEALTQASYSARNNLFSTQQAVAASHTWVEDRLGSVTVTAPPGVTLSSAAGSFSATMTNDLDEPVTARLEARTDDGIEISRPDAVQIPAQSRVTVPLDAEATTTSVHRVTLLVTDAEGTPIGSTQELPIRASQVSGVIWAIMGTGAGILFLAIGLRLVRRIRTARAAARPGAKTPTGPAAEPVP